MIANILLNVNILSRFFICVCAVVLVHAACTEHAHARVHFALHVWQQQRQCSSHRGGRSAKAALFPLNIHIHVTCCMLCMFVCLARLSLGVCVCERQKMMCFCVHVSDITIAKMCANFGRYVAVRPAWKCMRRLFCVRVVSCCMHNNFVKCVFPVQCKAHTYTRTRARTNGRTQNKPK